MTDIGLCSDCFYDQGLHFDAEQLGVIDSSPCLNCGSITGSKLKTDSIGKLAHRFFVLGTLHRFDFGAAPSVQFNTHQPTSIRVPPGLTEDIRLIERSIGVGFFYYGPRLWMTGEVEPLKALQEPTLRASIIERILTAYPTTMLRVSETFYRIRKSPEHPEDVGDTIVRH
jgi:hypothetical protein